MFRKHVSCDISSWMDAWCSCLWNASANVEAKHLGCHRDAAIAAPGLFPSSLAFLYRKMESSRCDDSILPLHVSLPRRRNPSHHGMVKIMAFSVLHHETHLHSPLSVVTPQVYTAELQRFMDATPACLVAFPNQQPHPIDRRPLCCPSSRWSP